MFKAVSMAMANAGSRSDGHGIIVFVPGRLAVMLAFLATLTHVCFGNTGMDTEMTVTNLAKLAARSETNRTHMAPIDIEGTVWWSSETEGRVILHDATMTLQLELDMPCTMPRQGERLRLKGTAAIVRGRDVVKLAPEPVVENDGLHSMVERSGTIRLAAGRHPICVAWFNRTDRFGLEVEYEGPGLPRRRIPAAALYYARIEPATGAVNYLPGLEYRCCEDQWWRLLPNFDHRAVVKSGIVDDFDIGVSDRESHVGLQFKGYISIPSEGEYTFYLSSDDGSRLYIGPSSLQVYTDGQGALPSSESQFRRERISEAPEYQWSSIEGDVKAIHRPAGGLELEVMTESGLVRIKVAEDSNESYLLRPQNRIRASGVSRRIRNLDGRWTRGEFYVQRWDDIEQRYVTPAIWTEYPRMQVADLAGNPDEYIGSVVHVHGRMQMNETSRMMELSDGKGSVLLPEEKAQELETRFIDVLGRVTREGTNLVLRGALYRQTGREGVEAGNLPLLTTIEQIYQLSYDESIRRYPVRVRGVITSPMESDGAVLQDSSRGIYVVLGGPINLQVGDFCEIEGFTGPYQFSQYIDASRVTVLGAGTLPEPVHPTWDQLINGSLHCNYVELEGVVASINNNTATLLTRGGRINVRLNPLGAELPANALGATVLLRGCLLADWDDESHRVVVGSIYLDQHWVTVVHPAPIDPFSIPVKHVGDLLQFDPQAGALQRVKVSGMLVHKGRDLCCLMDGANGLRFAPVGEVGAGIGDTVDVVGFLELGGTAPVLREAEVRKTGTSALPAPRRLAAGNLIQDEYDSTLVRVEGILLGVSEKPDKLELEMQNDLLRFVAELNSGLDADTLKPGSRLDLTGTYLGQGGNRVLARPIDSFRLLLNSDADIAVLSRPPWWTLRRMLSVVGFLAAVLVAALVWIKLLRRKVEERTEELGNQIRERQRAERQREIEQERARLAHDLHDDLGAQLTEVNMLASLVKSPATSAEEKNRYAEQLNDIALRMVTSLDEIVWAVNPRNDTISSLAGYFGAYAQRLLELASVNCGLDIAEDLPNSSLDPTFRQEMFLAFKEALTNVVLHANARKVWLRIFIQNKTLVVIVSDDGCGILSGKQEAGEDGLVNMQERMTALGGSCSIESDPEAGTVVRLQAPIRKAWE